MTSNIAFEIDKLARSIEGRGECHSPIVSLDALAERSRRVSEVASEISKLLRRGDDKSIQMAANVLKRTSPYVRQTIPEPIIDGIFDAEKKMRRATTGRTAANYLGKLRKRRVRGANIWTGKIDGLLVDVIHNLDDSSTEPTSWWDINVGKQSYQTRSGQKVSMSEVNKIVGKLLEDEKKSNAELTIDKPVAVTRLKKELAGWDYDLSDSQVKKIGDDVFKRLSRMSENELTRVKRGARSTIMDVADSGDDNQWELVKLALTIFYAKVFLGQAKTG